MIKWFLQFLESFDPVAREWKRQFALNDKSYRLHRLGFTFDQKQGRVFEAIPGWMVKHGSSGTGQASGGAREAAQESRAILYLHRRPPVD